MAAQNLSDGLAKLANRTTIARISLYVYFAAWSVTLPFTTAELMGEFKLENAEGVLAMIAAVAFMLAALATIVCFVTVGMWLYRAQDNLRLADVDGLEFTPGWAVGWYFVPFANFVMPFNSMRELVDKSDGQSADAPQATYPALLPIWWGGWLIGNILSSVSTQIALRGDGLMSTPFGLLDIISATLLLASAWCLLRIINYVDRTQNTTLRAAHAFT